MSIVAWLVLGLVAGIITSSIRKRTGAAMALDAVIGMVAALFTGFLYAAFAGARFGGIDGPSMLVALIGASLALAASHVIVRPRI